MSPELDRLLNAIWEYRNAAPKDRPRCKASVDRLVGDALVKLPGISRQELMAAIEDRYDQLCRSRRKFPSIPPKA